MRPVAVLGVALLLSVAAGAPRQRPAADVSKVLADIKARDTGQLAVSEEDGRFMRLLIASSGRKRALEIGGASGYSAIWIAQGLRETGGRLVLVCVSGPRYDNSDCADRTFAAVTVRKDWPMISEDLGEKTPDQGRQG